MTSRSAGIQSHFTQKPEPVMLYIIIVSLELLMKRLMDGFLTLSSFNEEYENKA